jgi:SAM-dependent methyltransferase
MATTAAETLAKVKEYYGTLTKEKQNLKSKTCCSADALPPMLREILDLIEPEILDRFYGCGSPIPAALEGCSVLDLGCGTGRDAYLVSKLVGEEGCVMGIDMTEEQLDVAQRHQATMAERFGYTKSNVDFRLGHIEDLKSAGVEDNTVDVVISNCVLNLSPEKERVFSEIFRVLKPGGELFFSDIFADRRIPKALHEDPVLLGECLGGAMYTEDFRRLLRGLGCMDFRVVRQNMIMIGNPEIETKVGNIKFSSRTIRAFKLPLEDICEDFGQVAYYRGGIKGSEFSFALDDHHMFYQNKPMLVCGNTAAMVGQTRLGKYFEVIGDMSEHHGAFPCGPAPKSDNGGYSSGGCC